MQRKKGKFYSHFKFNSLEVPKKLFISSNEFTVENNALTPTQKLKRKEAKEVYIKEIKEMYENAKLVGEE